MGTFIHVGKDECDAERVFIINLLSIYGVKEDSYARFVAEDPLDESVVYDQSPSIYDGNWKGLANAINETVCKEGRRVGYIRCNPWSSTMYAVLKADVELRKVNSEGVVLFCGTPILTDHSYSPVRFVLGLET